MTDHDVRRVCRTRRIPGMRRVLHTSFLPICAAVYLSIRALRVRVRGSDLGSSLHSRCNGKVARSSGRLDVGLDEQACRLVLVSSPL